MNLGALDRHGVEVVREFEDVPLINIDRIKISVMDNGVGIPAENLTRSFNHGFTTRKDGHGFGLHSGTKEMGGSSTVHSDGRGKGASFTSENSPPPQPASIATMGPRS